MEIILDYVWIFFYSIKISIHKKVVIFNVIEIENTAFDASIII